MKIVSRKQLMKLPAGIIYSDYKPCSFGELSIKGDTWTTDFLTIGITSAIKQTGSSDFIEKLFRAQETGESLEMDFDYFGREGFFDDEQLYAVWEKNDLIKLKEVIVTAIDSTPRCFD